MHRRLRTLEPEKLSTLSILSEWHRYYNVLDVEETGNFQFFLSCIFGTLFTLSVLTIYLSILSELHQRGGEATETRCVHCRLSILSELHPDTGAPQVDREEAHLSILSELHRGLHRGGDCRALLSILSELHLDAARREGRRVLEQLFQFFLSCIRESTLYGEVMRVYLSILSELHLAPRSPPSNLTRVLSILSELHLPVR